MSRYALLAFFSFAVLAAYSELADAQESQEKALRYHTILTKRPAPGYLFDRFYNTWLDAGTVEGLQTFLEQRAGTSDRTSDRLLLAFFHAKQGDDVKALEQFRTALDRDPENSQAWYQKAIVESRTLDFDTAIADLQKASELKPESKLATQIAKLQGKLYVRNRQNELAMQVWQQLLKDHPRDEELREDIIELQINEGLFDAASQLSETLVQQTKDPYKKVLRQVRSGDIYQRAGKQQKALELYGKTLQQVGHESWLEREVLAQIEQVFRREDDLAGLKDHYGSLLKDYPKRIQVRKLFAKLLGDLGENDEALQQFETILRLTPGDRANQEAYVEALSSMGKNQRAIAQLKALITQHPDDAELRIRLANLHHKDDDAQSAADAAEQYLQVAEKSEYAYLRTARLLQRFEQFSKAKEIYERLVNEFPDSIGAKESLAAFLYSQDEKEPALEIWRELAVGQDRSQVVRIARIMSARNEHNAAYELLQSRQNDLSGDAIYLGQLIAEAVALGKFDEAIPWARQRVRLAQSSSDLETAISQASQVITKADKTQDIISELEALEKRRVQQKCLLAELFERTGASRQADEVLKGIEEDQQQLAIAQSIRLFSQRQDWNKAAEALQRLIETPGGRKSVNIRRLVELYQRDYNFDQALTWVRQWKKLSPGSTLPWMTEARLLRQKGDNDQAVDVLRRAVQQFDTDVDVRARLAQAYSESGKGADAERIYWQLYDNSEDVGDKLRWIQDLTRVAEQQGKTKQLVERLEERRANNRGSVVPLLALAEAHRASGNYEERRKALLEATRMKPDDLQLLWQIARIEEAEGQWERSLTTLEQAASLDKTTRTKERMARLHLNYGDVDDGYAILYELAGSQQSDARSIEALADAMIGTQDWERAVEFLAPRLSQYPQDYRLQYLYALALEESDKLTESIDLFLNLLTVEQEIAGLAGGQNSQTPWSSYLAQIGAVFPDQSVEYMELGYHHSTVYRYRRQNQRAYSTSYRGGPATNVQMPSNVEMARKYALIHLISMSQMMDEEEADELAHSIADRGVPNAKTYLTMGTAMQNIYSQAQVLANENRDDLGMMGLWAMQAMNNPSGTDGELAAHAYRLFRKDYKQLAFMSAASAAASDQEYAPVLDEAFDLVPSFENPSMFLVMSLASALGSRPGQTVATAMSDQQKEKLTELIVQWYPRLKNLGQQGVYVFVTVASALRSSEDPGAFFKFLDEEVNRWRSAGSSRHAMQRYYTRRQNELIAPLQFPPTQLSDFPPHVLAMLATDPRSNPFGFQLDVDWSEVPAERVRSIRNPILRTLVAQRCENTALAEETLHQLLSDEQPLLDAHLLAAAKATFDEKPIEAASILAKARYLPMTRQLRERVDSALVALALDADRQKKENEQLVQSGRDAALRLRRARLQVNQRHELVSAMEELGLKEEAEKLEKRSSPSLASRIFGAVTQSFASPVSSQTAGDQVTKLLADGKKDQAVNLMTKNLRAHTQNAFTNPSYFGRNNYQTRQLLETIESHGLKGSILAKLDPGASTSQNKLGQYGVACEMLGETDKARAAYEKLLERRKNNDPVRLRLMALLAETDQAAAAKHLAELNPRSIDQTGQMLMQMVQNYEMDLKTRLHIARVIGQHLASLDSTDRLNLSWVPQLVEMIGNNMHGQNENLYSLYYTKEYRQRYSNTRDDLLELRSKVHEELCRTMLTIPQLAPDGFTRLLAVAEIEDKVDDGYVQLARDAILSYKPSRAVAQMRFGFDTSGQRVVFRTPVEFLARNAWKKKSIEAIDVDIAPQLEAGNKSEQLRELRQFCDLYTCEANQFLDKSKVYLDQQRRGQGATNPMGNYEPVTKVVEVWRERELSTEIREFVFNRLKNDLRGTNHYGIPNCLTDLAVALVQRDQGDQVAVLLEDLSEVHLGPKGKRAEFVEKYYDRRQLTSGTPNMRIYRFAQLLEQWAQRKELVFEAAEVMTKYGLTRNNNLNYRVQQAFLGQGTPNADQLAKRLAESPFGNDLDAFRSLRSESSGHATVFSYLLDQIRGRGTKLRDEVKKKLAESESKRFGVQLMVAYLDNDSATKVSQLLQDNLTAIQALPDEQQVEVAASVDRLLANAKVSGEVGAWLGQRRTQTRSDFIARLMKARRYEDLKVEAYELDNQMRERLGTLIESDPTEAVKAFDKYVEIVRDAKKRGRWNRSYGAGSTDAGQLVGQVTNNVYNAKNKLGYVAFALDVYGNKKGTVEIQSYARSQFQSALRNDTNDLRNKLRNSQEDRIGALSEYLQKLQDGLGERDSTIMATSYVELCGLFASDAKFSREAAEWLAKESEGERFPKLAREVLAALQLVRAEREQDKGKSQALMSEAGQHYLEMIGQEKYPFTWRLEVARFLCQRKSNPPEQTFECTALLRGAIEAMTMITSEQSSAILTDFIDLQRDSTWRESATELADTWNKRYLRSSSRSRDEQYLVMSPGGYGLIAMLALNLELEKDRAVSSIIRKYESSIAQDPQVLALLVSYDKHALAGRLVRSRWNQLRIGSPAGSLVTYDDEFAGRIKTFLETLDEQPAMKYFAETVLVAAPDTKGAKGPGFVDRDRRLEDMASRFGEVTFNSIPMKEHALLLLSESSLAAPYITESLAELAGKYDLPAVLDLNDYQTRQKRQRLITTHLTVAFQAGNPQPIADALDKLSKAKLRNTYYRNQVYSTISDSIRKTNQQGWQNWEPTQLAALGPIFDHLTSPPEGVSVNNQQAFAAMQLSISIMGGREAFDRWWNGLTKQGRSRLRTAVSVEVWKQVSQRFVGDDNKANVKHRVEAFADAIYAMARMNWLQYYGNTVIHRRRGTSSDLFQTVASSGLMTQEELLQHGPAIAAQIESGGLLWAALAQAQTSANKTEEAIESWSQAIAHAPEHSAKCQTQWRLKQAELLRDLAYFEEALEVLDSLDPDLLYNPSRQQFQQLKQSLIKDEESQPMVAALMGGPSSFDQWWQGLSKQQRSRTRSAVRTDVWRRVARRASRKEGRDVQHRIQVAGNVVHALTEMDWLRYWHGAVVHKKQGEKSELLQAIVSSGLLTKKELSDHGATLASKEDHHGLIWAALARTKQQEGELEAAAEMWEQAIVDAPKTSAKLQTQWRIRQAELLRELGRADAAREVLEHFDRDLIFHPDREQFENLLKELSASEKTEAKARTKAAA